MVTPWCFTSTPLQVTSLADTLMEECYMADEFKAISIDCTFRLMFALLGQVSYRAPRAIREEQAIAAADMVHALCSVRGITGAVLALEPLHTESAANIIAMLRRVFLAKHMGRVQFVISDDPSRHFLQMLQDLCPTLKALAADPMHIVFVYESAQWRKRSPGSHFLRSVVARVVDRDAAHASVDAAVYYRGEATEDSAVFT